MSEHDWARFEALVQSVASQSPTHARACGIAIAQLMDHAPPPLEASASLEWMDWERRKTLRLLRSAV